MVHFSQAITETDLRGPPDLKDQVIATIYWQSAQLQRVKQLLERLAKRGLLQEIVNKEKADHVLENHKEDVLIPTAKRLQKTLKMSYESSHQRACRRLRRRKKPADQGTRIQEISIPQ